MLFHRNSYNTIKWFAPIVTVAGVALAAYLQPEAANALRTSAELHPSALLEATLLGNAGAPILAVLLGSLIVLNSPKKKQ